MPWSNILVRATNWVGDAVLSLPALRALRARYPEARITVLARPWMADVYRRESFCDEILTASTAWLKRLAIARELRGRRFDAAILLPNSFEAALAAWLAGIPRRIGYNRDGRGLLLTDPIPPPKPGGIPRHESFYYLELLRRGGIIDELPPAEPIVLEGADKARCAGLERFAQMGFRGPIAGLSPGAQNSRAKQWLPERFAEAAVRLAESLGASVAIFGSAPERALARGIAEAIRREGYPVLSLAGETTLGEFIEMAAACRVFLTNDSGAMHLASALGVPTVAIFGPTDWIATAPGGPVWSIVRQPVECSPCMLRDCPIDHRCMTGVSAGQVAQAAAELME